MADTRLGVDHLTVLSLPPLEFVRVSARAGFSSVSLRTIHIAGGEPAWSTEPVNASLIAAEAASRGIRIHAIESVAITRELSQDMTAILPLLEDGAALGADFVYCFADDTETVRCTDTFTALAHMAEEHGIRALLEPMPYRAVATIPQAIEIVDIAGLGGILVDTLHASRGGMTPVGLTKLPQEQLAVLQLCDAPSSPPGFPSPSGLHPLMHEARFDRLDPGEGALPLAAFTAAMPKDALISVEAPGAENDNHFERLTALRAATLAVISPEGA